MNIVIVPPFTDPELATLKVQLAEDLWNTRDPERVAAAYTEDTQWRNRIDFLTGRAEVVEFLKRKWKRELDYKLKKELWGFRGNRMAVKFHGRNGMMTTVSGIGRTETELMGVCTIGPYATP